MPAPAKLNRLNIALLGTLALVPSHANAQWWTAAPADYEECAERVARNGTAAEARASQISDCEAKFAGRRRSGGGYTYYDFMQNRSFDIAGPNPTAAEQREIDEQYTAYLDGHRRSIIRAAFAEKQRQQQASLEAEKAAPPSVTLAPSAPVAVVMPRPRPKSANCASDPLGCGWSRLSAGLKDLKKTLFGPPAKARRG